MYKNSAKATERTTNKKTNNNSSNKHEMDNIVYQVNNAIEAVEGMPLSFDCRRQLRARAHPAGFYARRQPRYSVAVPSRPYRRHVLHHSPFWECLEWSLDRSLSFRVRGPPHRADSFKISCDYYEMLASRYGFTNKLAPGAQLFDRPPIPLLTNKLSMGYWLVSIRPGTFEVKIRRIKPKPFKTRSSDEQPFVTRSAKIVYELSYRFNKLEYSIEA